MPPAGGIIEAAAAVREWLTAHPEITIAAGAFSLLAFVGTLAAVPMLVLRLPADYFLDRCRGGEEFWHRHPGRRTAVLALKNLAGGILLLAGIAMLVLPGQGLLTILIALTLLDFPGKRALERRIIAKPQVLQAVNGMRRRAGRAPLRMDDAGGGDG